MKESAIARDKLVAELKTVIAEMEELLEATTEESGEKWQTLRAHVESILEQAKTRIGKLEEVVVDDVKSTAKAADGYIHENPWPAVGVGAGLGLIVGLILARK